MCTRYQLKKKCYKKTHRKRPRRPETTDSLRKKKRSDEKQGDRGLNMWLDNTYRVSEVSLKEQPLALAKTLAKFQNTLGFLVWDNLDITIRQWKDVLDDDK